MGRRFRPHSLAALGLSRPRVEERIRRHPSSLRVTVAMERAALKLTRDIAKRRARAMLADRGQLEMIELGLSALAPAAMVAKLSDLSRAARSLKRKSDPLMGRIDLHNLHAVVLAARFLRLAELRLSRRPKAA
jgi:hypothetical protein